jgi:hypothetical protein
MGRIANDFVKKAFAVVTHAVNCPCRKCQNFVFLLKNDISIHLCKNRIMLNYLVCREHGEVRAAAMSNENEDQMDEMIANIGMDYELGSKGA